jgi:hypothetical protein
VNDAVDGDEARNTEGEKEGTRNERRAESAGRIEAAMAAERDHDISAEVRKLPSGESAADGHDHGQFKEATADSARKATRCQDLREQSHRHSYLTAFRRLLQTFRFNGRVFFLLSYVPILDKRKIRDLVPKVTSVHPTKVE